MLNSKKWVHALGATSLLALVGGCAQAVDSSCPTGDGPGCAGAAANRTLQANTQPPAADALPPPGYRVKWSKCAHYIEGEATIRNNSRVVTVRSDGTVPVQRVEPLSDPAANARRVLLAKLPYTLLGGSGVMHSSVTTGSPEGALRVASSAGSGAGKLVLFVKLGQAVTTREADGSVVQWVVGSESLGEPVMSETGRLEYQDTCFRNPSESGKDTSGYIVPGLELAAYCVVEDMTTSYNAMSSYGYAPLANWATVPVPTANDPGVRPHPDSSTYDGFDGSAYVYSGAGAALNDINGAERDPATAYFGGEANCHMIVSGGLEVPGAKRPATRSLPAPGVINVKTFVLWRPVNPNVIIANDEDPLDHDPVEPIPPADEVAADDALMPM